MKRRGFFAAVAAAIAAPKAVKLLPAVPPKLTGLPGWLPEPDDNTYNPFSPLPRTVAGRLDWVSDMRADGCITDAQAARLSNIVSDPWEPDYNA